MVLKKSFDREETVDDIYDSIKMQKLAALCCQLFCARSTPRCQYPPARTIRPIQCSQGYAPRHSPTVGS